MYINAHFLALTISVLSFLLIHLASGIARGAVKQRRQNLSFIVHDILTSKAKT